MAYMNQEKKAEIAAALKLVVPQGWKYSLSVRNHSTIVMTITAAPFDIMAARVINEHNANTQYCDVNTHHHERQFNDECLTETIGVFLDALNNGNHDRSDTQTDYFDVGWYVDMNIGTWDRPFKYVPAPILIKA